MRRTKGIIEFVIIKKLQPIRGLGAPPIYSNVIVESTVCGIFGFLGKNNSQISIPRILDSLRHRGPDAAQSVRLHDAILAHTRLSILDLNNRGHQPLENAAGTAWIVFNGEIYNYLELKKQLSDYPFKTNTDTEVILAAYDRWGEDCLSHLRGMFSFAIFDQRTKTLFGAVDRFGIKPLLYCHKKDSFLFASEAKALAAAGVRLKPDDSTIRDYLALGHLYHDDRTFFAGIKSLPAAHKLRYQNGKLQVERYWSLNPNPVPDISDNDLVDYVDQQLRESIRLHLRSDVEYGLSLSSGLDSNFLRCLMEEEGWLTKPLNCFSFCFAGTPYDECADLLEAEVENAVFHKSIPTSQDLINNLSAFIRAQEGPVGGAGMFGLWQNMKLAHDNNIKVVLNGQGADELFLGYKHYYDLYLLDLFKREELSLLKKELEGYNTWHDTAYTVDSPVFHSWLKKLNTDATQASDGTSLGGCAFASAEFMEAHIQETPLPSDSHAFLDPVKKRAILDLQHRKMPKLLTFQDRLSMDHSVEVRVPFLDHVLFENLFSLPTNLLLKEGKGKWLMRKIARKYNDPLLRRYWNPTKKYMPTPQREWLKTELCEPIRQMITETRLHELGYIDKKTLSKEYEKYVNDPALGNSYFIWKFINLDALFNTFFTQDA